MTPNAETRRVLREVRAGKNLIRYASAEAMYEDLGLNQETRLSLPFESYSGKSERDLIHEIEINHERVNASGDGARKLFVENEALRREQRRNWEQYQLAIKERNEFETLLKEARKAVIDQSDLVKGKAEAQAKLSGAERRAGNFQEELRKARDGLVEVDRLLGVGAKRRDIISAIYRIKGTFRSWIT